MSKLFEYDNSFRTNKEAVVAGFDEVGRGPLCGPVVCAGVVLEHNYTNEEINDSKKLTDNKRQLLFDEIIKHCLAYSIQIIDVEAIDKINILEASRLGMQQAYNEISQKLKINTCITDYMKIKVKDGCRLVSIPKGDATSLNVAAASILAKVTRDRLLVELHKLYPSYNFNKNKGYGTKDHLMALEKFGPIYGVHRTSFKPVKKYLVKQLNLFEFE